MPLTVKQKTKVVALWFETKSYEDTHQRFCRNMISEHMMDPQIVPFNLLWNIFSKRVQCTTRARAIVAGQHQQPRAKPTSMPCGILSWTVPRSPTASAHGSSALNQHQSGVSSLRNWSFSHTSSLLGINWVKMTWEGDLICSVDMFTYPNWINLI